MTWNLWLDILLVILILLFAPIGFMRGPVKEIIVTLGVLFGALLADYWARPWGRDLDSMTGLGDEQGAFVVAMAFLVGATFIGGYGIGVALANSDFSLQGRLLGGFAAMFNGALLVSFTLQYVRRYLLSTENEESLRDSYVVRFLMDELGWLLLIVGILLIPLIAYILVTGRQAYRTPGHVDEYDYDDEYYDDYDEDFADEPYVAAGAAAAATRNLPPRVHPAPDEQWGKGYKAEPAPTTARPTDLTRPIVAAEVLRQADEPTTGAHLGDTDPNMAVVSASAATVAEEHPAEEAEPEPTPNSLPPGYIRCAHCHAVLPPDTRLCPVCGQMN
jgi:uncharacterized membrane protein required for colicin V production